MAMTGHISRRRHLSILSVCLFSLTCFAADIVGRCNAFVILPDVHANVFLFAQSSRHLSQQTEGKRQKRTTCLFQAKQNFKINENLVGSINSDGIFEGRDKVERPQSTKLGVASKKSSKAGSGGGGDDSQELMKSLSKKERQRTANGIMDSTLSTRIAAPEQEAIQVLEAKRGSKVVTIVRGMSSPMETRKEILKSLKKSLGVGGTLVEGVLEIQGAYAAKTVEALHKKGYVLAKIIGK